MSTPVLVTGGAGFIGSHACKSLAEAGFQPIVFDNLSAGSKARVQWGPLEEGDVRDLDRLMQVFATRKPQAVMHFAAQISVPKSVDNPQETYHINTIGSFNLLAAMRAHGVENIVFSSTAAVYGVPQTSPIPENAPKAPINPYGQSKLAVEHMLADFSQAYGINYAALRYFNAAGATPEAALGYQRPDPFHLVPVAMLAILGKRPPLQLFGTDYPTPDGTAVRDYIHVADLAEAHTLALRHITATHGNLPLNLGTSNGYSVQQILTACHQITGNQVPHTRAPRRPGDPPALVADSSSAKAILKWQPTQSTLAQIIASDWAWHSSLKA
jgi:UDP-glucose-4-epimerase GalE